ncbi:PspC domain-containing protein [Ochrovirga pacifica]|uniref:PspC domain-containing protein n=1 Tax=Ochrovirga pacifica TaxID=1042376 RepID=UPI0002557B51|nr:PspC domain-containing protein [Ochrovirga pacifica]
MNKTININLGGFFFHIDEPAYHILKKYLEAIANSLSDDPNGKDEILADIEARISELLSEKIQDNRQVVNEEDIQSIIKIMGQPEDYADVDEGYTEYHSSYQRKSTVSKKMFRDGDDKFLGGVASGIGHYFNVDAIWIRILFILLLPAGGFSVYTYIILWVLVPEAKTTAEKLQMQGEPVNIDNIEKKIRTEFENVSNKIKNADYSGAKSVFQNFIDVLGKILLRFFQLISKFIGIVLILLSIVLLVAFIISAFSFSTLEFIGLNEGLMSNLPFIYQSVLPSWLLYTCLFVAIGIPLSMVFYLGTRIVSKSVKQMSKVVSLTLLGIWIVSFLILVFTGVEYHSQNAYNGSKVYSNTLPITPKDTLSIKIINNDNLFFQNRLYRNNDQTLVTSNGEEKIYSNHLYFDIKKSENDSIYLKIRKKSEGSNHQNAIENADAIDYNYQLNNKQLVLDSYFLSPIQNRFRNESITITLYITNGTTLYLNNSTRNFINHYPNTKGVNISKLIDHHLLMTPSGLDCTDCNIQTSNTNI